MSYCFSVYRSFCWSMFREVIIAAFQTLPLRQSHVPLHSNMADKVAGICGRIYREITFIDTITFNPFAITQHKDVFAIHSNCMQYPIGNINIEVRIQSALLNGIMADGQQLRIFCHWSIHIQ